MRSTMMDYPLTLDHVLERVGRQFAEVEIVSRRPDKTLHRYAYGDFYERTRRLVGGLLEAGLQPGDRVATLMWNHYAHLEAYFAVPVAGGVLHTLNLRLSPEDLIYIINHAEDRFLLVDDVLLGLFDKVRDKVQLERVWVVPFSGAEPIPEHLESYEALLAKSDAEVAYPAKSEDDPCGMCYTSGTTGRPKGVVYSHRSTILHAFSAALPDGMNLSMRDTILPVVPMFHANAWGTPYSGALVGARQVYPGPHLDPDSLIDLFAREAVTVSAGVPTVWLGVLQALEAADPAPKLADLRLTVGGSAVPESLIRRFDRLGITVIQGWGMTETSPLASVSQLKPGIVEDDPERRFSYRASQGLACPFVDLRICDDEGREVDWNGRDMGEIQVRGPWITGRYYNLAASADKFTDDGWLRTGDVATISPDGYIRITDRTKDLIKSGGEWISSVDLENAIMGHPDVAEAAVIAMPDAKWGERPLAVVVPKEGARVQGEAINQYLSDRFAKWMLPDRYEIVSEIPRTSTGKFNKLRLRESYATSVKQ